MTVDELIQELRQKDILLWVEDDQLRYRGSEHALTSDLLVELGKLKAEVIALLGCIEEKKASPSPRHRRGQAAPVQLDYQFLGRSGLMTAEFALGPYSSTMIDPGADAEFSRLLDAYVAAGGNHIDLSNVYTRSEKRVGNWLKGKARDQIVISSKVGIRAGDGPNDIGLSRKHILESVNKSLRDLGTDYIDVYYTHIWDGGTPLEETISALNDVVRAGKARYLGLSNLTGWQLQKAVDIAKFTGKEPFICLQTQYNLIDRYPELEQVPVCHNEGLGIVAWGSLSAGWLTGRYRRGMSPSDIGDRPSLEGQLGFSHNSFEFKNTERTWKTIDVLLEVAAELEKTPAQVALNWLKQRSGVVPILGPRNVAQLEDSLGAVGWALSADQQARLDGASCMPPTMPHMFIQDANPPERQ